jgi:hypothetical protein
LSPPTKLWYLPHLSRTYVEDHYPHLLQTIIFAIHDMPHYYLAYVHFDFYEVVYVTYNPLFVILGPICQPYLLWKATTVVD